MIFFFILIMACCVYSLESPRWGDFNENTQHAFMLKEIEKLFLLCHRTWRYNQPSLARTIPVSNLFSWSQRCSSHRSSTVFINTVTWSDAMYNVWWICPDLTHYTRRSASRVILRSRNIHSTWYNASDQVTIVIQSSIQDQISSDFQVSSLV